MNRLQRVKQLIEEQTDCKDPDKLAAEIDDVYSEEHRPSIDAVYSEEHSPASEHFRHILGMRDRTEGNAG